MRNIEIVERNKFSFTKFDFDYKIHYDYIDENSGEVHQRIIEATMMPVNFTPRFFEYKNHDNLDRMGNPKEYKLDDIDKYCFFTLVKKYSLDNPDNYSFDIIEGYYGDEVSHVVLKQEIFDKFIKDMKNVLCLNGDIKKLEYVFNLDLTGGLVKISNVKVNQLKCDYHIENLDYSDTNIDLLSFYIDFYGLPVCIIRDKQVLNGVDNLSYIYSSFKNTKKVKVIFIT